MLEYPQKGVFLMEININSYASNFLILNTKDMIDDFVSYLDCSKRTVETYIKGITSFIYYIKRYNITTPSREDIISFREYLRQNLKPATIKTYLAGLRRFFAWAEMRGLWVNIASGIKGVKLDKGFKKDCLTSLQAKNLLLSVNTNTIKGKRDFAILALMLTTGLRDIEVSRALVQDIRVVSDCTVLFIQGKGHSEKGEYVKLSQPVEDAIRCWLSERDNVISDNPIFCSISNNCMGKALTTRSISRIVKNALCSIGLDSERLTAHSLRHTAATLNLIAGGTLEETQQLLRHASITTTQIYAHNLKRISNNSEIRISDKIFG